MLYEGMCFTLKTLEWRIVESCYQMFSEPLHAEHEGEGASEGGRWLLMLYARSSAGYRDQCEQIPPASSLTPKDRPKA